MQPFDMPELYRPHPARLNPHVGSARGHSRRWALRMGMLDHRGAGGAAVWDEARFEAMDVAMLGAGAHPDAPESELCLLTDWYVWGLFFTDDLRETFGRTADREGVTAYLDRLSRFAPAHADRTPEPWAPDGPAQRALADLWPRTVPGMPTDWRRRFADGIRRFVRDGLRGLENAACRRVPDPIEYVAVRRAAGVAPWAADLVEHAAGAVVPADLVATRQMAVLRDTFADGVHLLDDLFSYRGGPQGGGEPDNGVLVVQRFLDCSPQTAADRVNDLRTSRLRQFENTAASEVPLMFQELGVSAQARVSVAAYVRGLQDWQAGCCDWHVRSGRYTAERRPDPAADRPYTGPTGLGRSAARLRIPAARSHSGIRQDAVPGARGPAGRTPGHPFVLPPFDLPWQPRLNPHVDSARDHARTWARDIGLLSPLELPPGPPIWDEETFDSDDWPLFAALTHPDATEEQLRRVALWDVTLAALDDFFVTAFKRPRDLAGGRSFVERMPHFMPLRGQPTAVPVNQVERALVDVWARTAPAMPPRVRERFPGHVVDFVGCNLWELFNIIQGRVPDPVDHLEMRRRTAGTDLSIQLTAYLPGREIPPGILRTAPMRTLVDAFADTVGIRNDVHSYRRELEGEHELANGVLTTRHFLGCDLQHAVDISYGLFTARIREFEHTAAVRLPRLFDELRLEREERDRVLRFVRTLQDWMAGDNQWYRQTGRYTRPLPQARLLSAAGGRSRGGEPSRSGPLDHILFRSSALTTWCGTHPVNLGE